MENTRIFDILDQIHKNWNTKINDLIKSLDITLAEYNFFTVFDDYHTLTCASISKKMDLSLSRVSRVIDRMVLNDLITRKMSPFDRRAISLKLSNKGMEVYNKIMQFKIENENSIHQNFNKEEVRELESSLNKVLSFI